MVAVARSAAGKSAWACAEPVAELTGAGPAPGPHCQLLRILVCDGCGLVNAFVVFSVSTTGAALNSDFRE